MNWCFNTSVSTPQPQPQQQHQQQQNTHRPLIEQLVLCTSYSQLLFDQTLLQDLSFNDSHCLLGAAWQNLVFAV
jgi:hypothetical protein